jgi:hypothetical protein
MNKNTTNENTINGNTINEDNETIAIGSTETLKKTHHYVEWSEGHENILVDWADKALCYKWLHNKSHTEYSRKNTWFTIPVIIMSTLTGTANFAQDRIPAEYLNVATMGIGAVNLIAGILTTIQQFLKITELNESHRVSSIAWGKFYRNIKIEISKSPIERTPVVELLKHAKEEFDRLVETSPSLSNNVVKAFMDTFSGGELNINGEESQLNKKQLNFKQLRKPDICGSIEPTAYSLYKRKEEIKIYQNTGPTKIEIENNKNKIIIESFIEKFNSEKKRYPTKDEVIDNLDVSIHPEFINTVYNNAIHKNNIIIEIDLDDSII